VAFAALGRDEPLKVFKRWRRVWRHIRSIHAKTFITVLIVLPAVAVLVVPIAGEAQQTATIPRIGFLSASSPADARMLRFLVAFRQGLQELGYVESQNIAIEARWAEGQYDRLPGLAVELVRLKVNAIVTYGAAIQAAQQATETIPIVMAVVIDPVTPGFVASLARPGGNITGLSSMAPELVGKQLEILKEIFPKVGDLPQGLQGGSPRESG